MLSHGTMSVVLQSDQMVNLKPIKRRHFTGDVTCFWVSLTWKVKELNAGVGFILELTVFMGNITFIGMLR